MNGIQIFLKWFTEVFSVDILTVSGRAYSVGFSPLAAYRPIKKSRKSEFVK